MAHSEHMGVHARAQAEEALKSGLVDSVVAKPEDLLPAAKALALDIANGAKPRVQALKKTDKLPNMMARDFPLVFRHATLWALAADAGARLFCRAPTTRYRH